MRKSLLVLPLAAAIVTPLGAAPHPVHKAATGARAGGACASLAHDLDWINRSLAMNFADTMAARNGAARSEAQAEHSELLMRVQNTLGLMRDHHCSMPASEQNGDQYADQALDCGVAKINAGSGGTPVPDAVCDIAKWVPKRK